MFGQKNASFLHIISAVGIKPLLEKVQAIAEFQEPAVVKGLRNARYLEMLNFSGYTSNNIITGFSKIPQAYKRHC